MKICNCLICSYFLMKYRDKNETKIIKNEENVKM